MLRDGDFEARHRQDDGIRARERMESVTRNRRCCRRKTTWPRLSLLEADTDVVILGTFAQPFHMRLTRRNTTGHQSTNICTVATTVRRHGGKAGVRTTQPRCRGTPSWHLELRPQAVAQPSRGADRCEAIRKHRPGYLSPHSSRAERCPVPLRALTRRAGRKGNLTCRGEPLGTARVPQYPNTTMQALVPTTSTWARFVAVVLLNVEDYEITGLDPLWRRRDHLRSYRECADLSAYVVLDGVDAVEFVAVR